MTNMQAFLEVATTLSELTEARCMLRLTNRSYYGTIITNKFESLPLKSARVSYPRRVA